MKSSSYPVTLPPWDIGTPLRLSSWAAALADSPVRPVMITSTLWRWNILAISFPTPRVPPVTRAILCIFYYLVMCWIAFKLFVVGGAFFSVGLFVVANGGFAAKPVCYWFCKHTTHSSLLPILSCPTMVRLISSKGMFILTATPSSM